MTQEATRRWGLVGEFGGVAFEGYILGVHGGMEIGVFTSICAHVCMKVRGWCTVSHGHSLPQCSNFLGTETFHPGGSS